MLATGKGWLAAVFSVSFSMVIISSQQGQIPGAKALAGGLSSLGTIAQPGSGSRTWGASSAFQP